MRVLLPRMILLAGLCALAATAAPRAAAQATAPAAGQTAPPRGNATPFPGGAAPAGAGAKSTSAAPAPVATPTKVAVVNIQEAMLSTQGGKKEFDALKKKFDPQEAALKSMNDELDKMKADLAAAQSLSPDDRAKRQKLIEQKASDMQARFDTAQKSYQQAEGDVVNRLGPKMMNVMQTYAKAKGFDMVVDVGNPQTPVLWAGDRMNITQAVVEAYDKAYPLK